MGAKVGTHHKDSDIDLAILLVSNKNNLDIQIDLMQERKDDELDIEPHPIKEDEFNVNNPIYDEIINTGIELIPETA